MPRVPTYDNFQAAPTGLPQARLSAPAMPNVAGQQNQQMAQNLGTAGNAAARAALDMQQQANQVRVDDALNRIKEESLRLTYDKDAGFTNLRGLDALERPDGKPLTDEYSERLQKQISDVSASLGNDAQRAAFGQHAGEILAQMRANATRHESSEFKSYSLSTAEGIQATAMREIALGFKDPATVDSAITRIRAETYRQAKLLGRSAEWQDAQARKLTSEAHRTALQAALVQNDVTYADAYLKHYADQMEAGDILAVRGSITKEMDARVGISAAASVMEVVTPRMAPSDFDRAFSILIGTESGGRQMGSDGKPLTSSAGAIGVAQVMPGTAPEAAKLAGLEWDEQRYKTNAAYNAALGRAYFDKQLKDTGGDLAKAYAAYNAGPGRLKEAEAQAERSQKLAANDPNVQAMTWLDFMPKETRDYVAKNMGEYGKGGGRPEPVTLAELKNHLRAVPELASSPARMAAAERELESRFKDQQEAIKQTEDAGVARALEAVAANGGDFNALDIATRHAIPADKLDTVMSFAKKVRDGNDVTDPKVYARLASRPELLARMSNDQFMALRPHLDAGDFQYFAKERGRQRTGESKNAPGELNTTAIKSEVDTRLRMFGMDPTPKDGSGDAERVGAIRKFINDYFISAQAEAGKKFNDAEVVQHLDALFAKNTTVSGLFSDSSVPTMTMGVGDIPKADRAAIEAAYQRRGVTDPTDAQILQIYWAGQTKR